MKTFFSFTLIFFCLCLPAQPEINWLEKQDFEIRNNDYHQILGTTSDSELVVISGNSGSFLTNPEYYIETFDLRTGTTILYNRLSLPFLERKENKLKRFLLLNDQLLVFYTSYNRQKEKNYLIGIPYNSLGAPTQAATKIDSVTVYSSSRKGTFSLAINPQNTAFLVYPNPPFEVEADQKLHYNVFDSNLLITYSRKLDIPFKSREFELTNLMLGEDGKAFFLVKVTNLFKRWNAGQPNFKYVVIETTPNSNEIKEFEIQLDQLSISNITFCLDSNKLVIVGLYSREAKSQAESIGYFFIEVDTESRSIQKTQIDRYPTVLLNKLLTPAQLAKEREPEEFVIKNLVRFEDGTYTLLLEQYIYRQVCNTDIRTGIINCVDNYYYNDIVGLRLNQEGKATSSFNIPKQQYASTAVDYSSSFIQVSHQNRLAIVFNDDPKNLKENYTEKPRSYSFGSKHLLVNASATGDALAFSELKTEGLDRNMILLPRRSLKLSPNMFVVYAESRNQYQFGILTFTHQ